MSIKIINGYTGENHIYGYDVADLNRGIFGKSNCILGSNVDGTGNLNCVVNGNNATIQFENGIGSIMFCGVQAVINGAEDIPITARTENRTDIVAAVYNKTADGVESISLRIFENTTADRLTPITIDTTTTTAYFPLFIIAGASSSALTITKLYAKRALLSAVENDNKILSQHKTPDGADYQHDISVTTGNEKSNYAIQVTDSKNSNNIWRYNDLVTGRVLELGELSVLVNVLGALTVNGITTLGGKLNLSNDGFDGKNGVLSSSLRLKNGDNRNCTIYVGQDASTTSIGCWDSANNHAVWYYTTAQKLLLGAAATPVKLNGVATDKNDNNLTINCLTAYNNNQATISKDNTDQKITLVAAQSVGSDLSISNGGIKIGSNIKKVLVSGIVKIDPASSGAKLIRIFKNTSVIAQAREYLSSTADNSVIVPPRLINVTAGDIIYLNVYAAKNDKIPSAGTASYITVQAVG